MKIIQSAHTVHLDLLQFLAAQLWRQLCGQLRSRSMQTLFDSRELSILTAPSQPDGTFVRHARLVCNCSRALNVDSYCIYISAEVVPLTANWIESCAPRRVDLFFLRVLKYPYHLSHDIFLVFVPVVARFLFSYFRIILDGASTFPLSSTSLSAYSETSSISLEMRCLNWALFMRP